MIEVTDQTASGSVVNIFNQIASEFIKTNSQKFLTVYWNDQDAWISASYTVKKEEVTAMIHVLEHFRDTCAREDTDNAN